MNCPKLDSPSQSCQVFRIEHLSRSLEQTASDPNGSVGAELITGTNGKTYPPKPRQVDQVADADNLAGQAVPAFEGRAA